MPRPPSRGSGTVLGECVADAFADPARSAPQKPALRVLPGEGPAHTAVALARLRARLSHDVLETNTALTGSVPGANPSSAQQASLTGAFARL